MNDDLLRAELIKELSALRKGAGLTPASLEPRQYLRRILAHMSGKNIDDSPALMTELITQINVLPETHYRQALLNAYAVAHATPGKLTGAYGRRRMFADHLHDGKSEDTIELWENRCIKELALLLVSATAPHGLVMYECTSAEMYYVLNGRAIIESTLTVEVQAFEDNMTEARVLLLKPGLEVRPWMRHGGRLGTLMSTDKMLRFTVQLPALAAEQRHSFSVGFSVEGEQHNSTPELHLGGSRVAFRLNLQFDERPQHVFVERIFRQAGGAPWNEYSTLKVDENGHAHLDTVLRHERDGIFAHWAWALEQQ